MKKPWIVAFTLLFLAVPSFAETPSRDAVAGSNALAAILAPVAGACATQPSGTLFAATSQTKALCTVSASCGAGVSGLYCESNSSPTACSGADRNCPYQQGYVTCNGVTTWCATCPEPENPCMQGTIRQRACCRCSLTGDCWDCNFCDNGFFVPDACP